MRKLGLLLFTLLFSLSNVTAWAQELKNAPKELRAVITSEDFIAVDKKALFDASDSMLLKEKDTQINYIWNFGDNTAQQIGKEVIHTFAKIGNYKINLTIEQEGVISETEKEIYVYSKKGFLITDTSKETTIKEISQQALNYGIWLKIITARTDNTGLIIEEDLTNQINAESEFIKGADMILSYTQSNVGIQAFSGFWQRAENQEALKLNDKLFINITDEDINTAARLSKQAFEIFHPQFILLTRKEAFNPIFQTQNTSDLINTLGQRAIEYEIIDERSETPGYFFLSKLISSFTTHGISTNTLYLILALPFITFLICFARQVVGISTFGVYTPTVLVLGFMVMGIWFGLSVLLIVVLVSYLLRTFFEKTNLLYIPKVALLISLTSISFLAIIWFILFTDTNVSIAIAIFPMLVMSTLSEKFISTQSEEGIKSAFLATVETILVAVAGYYLTTWSAFSNTVIAVPELIILPIIGTLILGKFAGLRLTEYFRFRSIVKSDSEE